jgi:DHA2 family multidrug resistance protein-like MFS transporter
MLGRGMAINAMVISVSAASGPTLAGLILSFASWNWLFLINLPLGIVALMLGWKLLPSNPPSNTKRSFDKISALGNALTFGLLIYTLEGVAHAENRMLIYIQFLLLLVIGTLYIRRQQKLATPILPVDLFKIPIFSLSIGSSTASFTAQMLAMVSLPFFLQNVLGFDAVEIGLLMTPWPLATILAAPLSSRLLERHVHPGLLGGIGMAIFAFGLSMLFFLPDNPEKWQLVWRMAICGMGYGLFQTPNNVTITASAPIARSGGASGMLGTARQLGQTLGATAVALIFRFFAEDKEFQMCILFAIVFAILSMILSVLRMPRKIG